MLLTHKNAEEEMANIDRCLERQVDGFIANLDIDTLGSRIFEKYTALKESGMPMVELLGDSLQDVPKVIPDLKTTGYTSTKHLIDKGHRNIAMVTHERYNITLKNPGQCWDAWYLYKGYRKAIEEAGLKEYVITHPIKQPPDIAVSDWLKETEPAVDKILNSPDNITSAICFVDYEALALIKGMQTAGRKVPDDFAVVGNRDLPACLFEHPFLTTQTYSSKELGKAAAEVILKQLEGLPVKNVLIAPKLIERETT
jgi:DNA-binding LacI/PurR family transcriptional regulator